jgi:ABC-2 type transport system permease protein
LVKKIYLPREVFPIASVGAALFNFVIQLAVLLVATLVLGHFPFHPDLVYAIPAILVIVTFGTALALMLSAMNVYLRDVQYLVEVLLLILMWSSPIVYGWSTVKRVLGPGTLLNIYTDNPITLAVLGFQRAFWTSGKGVVEYPANQLLTTWIAVGVGLAAIFACQQIFARLQGNFAQVL